LLLLKKSPLFGYFFRRSGKSNRPPRRRSAAQCGEASPQLQTLNPAPQINGCTRIKAKPKQRTTETVAPTPDKSPSQTATRDAGGSVPYKSEALKKDKSHQTQSPAPQVNACTRIKAKPNSGRQVAAPTPGKKACGNRYKSR
jgi:hypothetical protein